MIDREKKTEAISLFRSGFTLREIATKYGVTHQAVSLWIKKAGLTRADRADRVKKKTPFAERKFVSVQMNEFYLKRYGAPIVELQEYMTNGILRKFSRQRKGALQRGIGWDFTFPQWLAAWIDSGHWNDRGQGGQGYVMARKGDVGPYAPRNVYFCTSAQNVIDSFVSTPFCRRKERTDIDKVKSGFYLNGHRSRPASS